MTDSNPAMDSSMSKAAGPTPPHSASSADGAPKSKPEQLDQPMSADPTPPASQSGPKQSISADSTAPILPQSPSSTTPVLEKDELDFTGNVDVNDNIPTQKDLDRVGDLLVRDAQGESRPFKSLYMGEGVAPRQLIIFVRHFFCGNCQEYLRTLSSSITPESLLALPTPTFITVIGCGQPELIDMYVQTTSCSFPVFADPTRKLYDVLGMTRTLDLGKKKPEYFQSNMFVTTVQSILQGLKTGTKATKGGDFRQVGGEFLLEDGKCVWAHRMRNTRDHAEVTKLREVLGLDDTKPPMRKRWSHGIKELKKGSRSASWGRGRSKSKGASSIVENDIQDKPQDGASSEKPTV